MKTNPELLRAILDNPEDDAVRLVYADWLEENGETDHAEFIRVQCEVEHLDPLDDGYYPLRRRERELWSVYARKWARALDRPIKEVTFRRGFPDQLSMTVGKFLACGEKLFANWPIRGVVLRRGKGTIEDLARSPLLGKIRKLSFREYQTNSEEIQILLDHLHAHQVEELEFTGVGFDHRAATKLTTTLPSSLRHLGFNGESLTTGNAEVLVAQDGFRNLKTLRLFGDSPQNVKLLQVIANSENARSLQELRINGSHNPNGQAKILAKGRHLEGLKRLWFGHYGYPGGAPKGITHFGIKGIANSPYLNNLESLWLPGHTSLGAGGLRSLAEGEGLQSVTSLWINEGCQTVSSGLGSLLEQRQALTELLQSPLAMRLRELRLFDGDKRAFEETNKRKVLAQLSRLPNILRFDYANHELFTRTGTPDWFANLRVLGTAITEEIGHLLLSSDHPFPHLQHFATLQGYKNKSKNKWQSLDEQYGPLYAGSPPWRE